MNLVIKPQPYRRALQSWLIIVTTMITLSGCVTALVAGAAIATVDILHDRRSAGEYVDDATIELTAKRILLEKPAYRSGAHVKTVSWNGILLITGEIDDELTKQELVAKLSSIQGVRQLVDETTITGKTALLARTNDAWITSKVKSKLLVKTGLDANRVKVITTRGTVYLMGIVTQREANKATDIARAVKGVAKVVKVFEYSEDTAA
ncbi:MAG: BON domain-containing protein [Gammaproteobacteria bacterium]|nr:BON domain-containing protein [Gammaproteobacteria bacterium]